MGIEIAGVLVLVLTAIASVRFGALAWRRRVPVALNLAGTVDMVCGLLALGLAAAHLVGIVAVASIRAFDGGSAPAYTLRFYWLFLLGISVATPGFLCVMSATPLTAGEPSAWRRAFAASMWLLVVTGMLIPLNGFGTFLASFAVMNVGSLMVVRGRCGVPLRSPRLVQTPMSA